MIAQVDNTTLFNDWANRSAHDVWEAIESGASQEKIEALTAAGVAAQKLFNLERL